MIGAGRQQAVGFFLYDRAVAVLLDLAVIDNKVVVAVNQNQALAGNDLAVFSVIAVSVDAGNQRHICHFAVLVKVVGACGQQTVCEICGNGAFAVQLDRAVINHIIIVAVKLYQTVTADGFAVFVQIIALAVDVDQLRTGHLDSLAVRAAVIPSQGGAVGGFYKDDAGFSVAAGVEQIGVAVDLLHEIGVSGSRFVVGRAVPISVFADGQLPCAVKQLAVLIGERDLALIFDGAVCACKRVGQEVIPVAVDLKPAGGEHAVVCVIVHTVQVHQAGVCAERVTVFVKRIIYAVDLGDAGRFFAVDVIGVVDPALCRQTVRIEDAVGIGAVKQLAAIGTLQNAVHKVKGMLVNRGFHSAFDHRGAGGDRRGILIGNVVVDQKILGVGLFDGFVAERDGVDVAIHGRLRISVQHTEDRLYDRHRRAVLFVSIGSRDHGRIVACEPAGVAVVEGVHDAGSASLRNSKREHIELLAGADGDGVIGFFEFQHSIVPSQNALEVDQILVSGKKLVFNRDKSLAVRVLIGDKVGDLRCFRRKSV